MVAKQKTKLARRLAPEEIRTGQYVAVIAYVCELLPFCMDESAWRKLELRRIEVLPWEDFLPLKVGSICLPFVQVKSPRGKILTLDVRRYRLARLDRAFGKHTYQLYQEEMKGAGRTRRQSRTKRKKKSK